MESKSLSSAMSKCDQNPSCRKFYATQSHIDERSYYHYCGLHSQDSDFTVELHSATHEANHYTLYTKKGKIHMIIRYVSCIILSIQ